MPLGTKVGLSPGDSVLDGDPASLPTKGVEPPQFSAHVYCGQTAGWIKMPLGTTVGLGPGDTVLDDDPLPTKGVEPPPQLSADFYCGQTAGCIKMSLGMEVGLSPWDFVLDGDPGPLSKNEAEPRSEPPTFGPCLLWPNGWMNQDGTWHRMEVCLGPVHIVLDGDIDPLPKKGAEPPPIVGPSLLWPNGWIHQDATWYGGRPQPRRLCVRWDPAPLPKKGAESLNFWPMSIAAKRLHESRCHLVRR